MLTASWLMRKILISKSERIRFIPIQILSIFLVLLEIGKQITSIKIGYDLNHLPFHFCSMFIFIIPLSAFYHGRFKERVRSFTLFTSATLFLFMLICPAYAYPEEKIEDAFGDFLCFHAITFHNIVIFVFLLFVFLDLYKPSVKFDLKNGAACLSVYCIIGSVTSQIFKSNYNNFYYCNAEPVNNVRLKIIELLGYTAGQTVYVLAVSAVSLIFSIFAYCIYARLRLQVKN